MINTNKTCKSYWLNWTTLSLNLLQEFGVGYPRETHSLDSPVHLSYCFTSCLHSCILAQNEVQPIQPCQQQWQLTKDGFISGWWGLHEYSSRARCRSWSFTVLKTWPNVALAVPHHNLCGITLWIRSEAVCQEDGKHNALQVSHLLPPSYGSGRQSGTSD